MARSADILAKNILSDPTLVGELQATPDPILRQQAAIAKAETPLETDPIIYRIVVSCLGGVILIVAIGIILLVALKTSVTIPDGLVAFGSAAVGALAGLLAPSPASSRI